MARLPMALGAPLLLALLLWPLPARAEQALQIWVGEPARLALSIPAPPGQTLLLEHVNSIYDAIVRETYLIGPGEGFVQVAMESASAGVFEYHGYDPPPGGRVSLNRPLGQIRLLSSGYERHRVSVGVNTIGLADWAESGRPVILKIVNPEIPSPSGHP